MKILTSNIIDGVLLDINMPIMDGFECCQKMKENKDTQNIPVIFLTASTEPSDIRKCKEIGGTTYITKPFDFDHLKDRIERFIVKRFIKNNP